MRYAIISDIHANLEATRTVMRYIDEHGADRIICLGDVVGYNASPNECAELLIKRRIPTICGNHDAVASGIEEPWGFNPVAKESLKWTRKTMNKSNLEWLGGLRDIGQIDSMLAVHGSPQNRNTYMITWEDVLPHMDFVEDFSVNVCFFGHTHTPAIFARDGVYAIAHGEVFEMDREKLYFINPGSVGQPRDGDPRASFGFYDSEALQFELIRLEYPVKETAERITKAGLPAVLGERLFLGR